MGANPAKHHDADTDAKETIRGLLAVDDPGQAATYIDELIADMADESMPPEVQSLAVFTVEPPWV